MKTPLDEFLIEKFGSLPWEQFRRNFKTEELFIRACHEKIDGLRILQFLKGNCNYNEEENAKALKQTLALFAKENLHSEELLLFELSFENSPVSLLNHVRDALFEVEMNYRKIHWNESSGLTTFYN